MFTSYHQWNLKAFFYYRVKQVDIQVFKVNGSHNL